jgi:hypothetical protein
MASSYSTRLRLELPATGEQASTWGSTTNGNLGTLLESAVAGIAAITMPSDADYTLTATNGATDEARCAVLSVASTGSLTATRGIIIPSVQKTYLVVNLTTGSQSITPKVSGQTGPAIPNGCACWVYCDGTNTFAVTPPINRSAYNITVGAITATGTVTAAGFAGPLTGAVTGNVIGNLTGTVAAPNGTTGVRVGVGGNGIYSDTTNYLAFIAGNNYAGRFDSSGNLAVQGNVSWSSDRRLKADLRPMRDGLARALRIMPCTFIRKDTGAVQLGIIAQDAQQAHPLAVSGEDEEILKVNGPALDAILFGAIHDLAREMNALRVELAALRGG